MERDDFPYLEKERLARPTLSFVMTLDHTHLQERDLSLILAIPRIFYFPVKRVVSMLPRACHSVPLFPAAVCGGHARLSASAWEGRALCGVAPAAPPSLHNAPWPGAAGVCLTAAAVPEPSSPWVAPAGT